MTAVQLPPLGSLLATTSKQDLEELCSPLAWTPLTNLEKLPEDSGSYFRDQNAARFPPHVFKPALESIHHHNPEFNLNDLDIFACVRTLRNLLRFVTNPDQGFRMIVEAIGPTVFLVRQEASPTEIISGVFEYGHTFPEANTTSNEDVKGLEFHQRILNYNFAGISYLHRPDTSHVGDPAGDADELLRSLQQSSVSSVAAEKITVLAVETAGTVILQSAMFDLKTRTAGKEYKDVPNFVIGFHNRGVFSDVRFKNVQRELKKLAALLRTLTAFARGQLSGIFELVFEGRDSELELREVGGVASCCISDELKRCWRGGNSEEAQLEMEKTADEKGMSRVGEEWDEEEERRSCGWNDDSESEKDFTACSASDCGYCGHCTY
ncbi:hypothetical protein BJX65DRAFT_297292 [Aspergillus insuetus]